MFLRHLRVAAVGAALALGSSLAVAQPSVERFENLTSLSPLAGTPTFTAGSPSFSTAFGPPDITLSSYNPYRVLGGQQHLALFEETDQSLSLTWGLGLPDTAGVFQQWAFAIKVESLDPTLANNSVDILYVDGLGSTTSSWGVIVEGATGNIRMANSNGFGSTRIIAANAFNPGSPANWADGRWRVLITRMLLAGGGGGSVSWWILDPQTNTLTPVPTATVSGLTNTRTAAIDSVGFGATFAAGGLSDQCEYHIDDLMFFPVSDPNYDTEAEFLSAVQSYVATNWNPDTDRDSVSNAVEDAAPNSGDGNNDGFDDAISGAVASVPNAVNGQYITLEANDPDETFSVVTPLNITTAGNDGATLPVGLIGFTLEGLIPGETTSVDIIYQNALVPAPTNYYKYDDDPQSWWHYSGPGKAIYNAATKTTTLTLTDGDPDADNDLTADGRILDPSGPGFGGVLAADVVALTATAPFAGAPVTIAWTTTAELDNAGFTVKNAATGAVVGSFVPAEGSASSGASYSVVDADTLEAGEVRTYVLEDIDLSGKATTHGPVTATITGGASSVGNWTKY